MLDALNSYVKEFADLVGKKVSFSKDMLDKDIHTELAVGVKKSMEDPLKSLMEGSARFDEIIMGRVDEIVENFFRVNSDSIARAYKLASLDSHMNYLIALNEDTPDNRDSVFSIQYHFEDNFDPKYSIRIHFIPKESLELLENNVPIDLQPTLFTS
jgi:hypothetical protein